MRITSGNYKNRKIITQLKNSKVIYRPTTDRTRQAIFNIIFNSAQFAELKKKFNHSLIAADIFCGSGSFGLECLSRGAEKVYFIDIDSKQIELASMNVASINKQNKSTFVTGDASKPLVQLAEPCDLIFIDPPYNNFHLIINDTINTLLKSRWVGKKTIIIIECATKEGEIKINPSEMNKELQAIDERVYGKTKIIFFIANTIALYNSL